MKKAESIFGSKPERNAFNIIEAQLPPGWSLFPNLPLPQVVRVEKSDVSEADWEFYLKSSVDFVLTTPTGALSLAMEFDGLARGFNAGSVYTPLVPNPIRERTINFKLDLCRKVDLPLYVISFDEIQALPGEDMLRLVHGLVAQHIVDQEMTTKLRHWDSNERGHGKNLDEMLWDWSEAETSLQHKYDPFRKGLASLWEEFSRIGVTRWSLKPLSRPDMITACRTKKPIESVGCCFTAPGEGQRPPVTITVWVRNFAGEALGYVLSADIPVAGSVNPLRIAENAALYLGVKRVVELHVQSR